LGEHGEESGGAGNFRVGIADDDGVTAGVGDLDIGDGVVRRSSSGDIRSVELPLVGERGEAGGGDGESGIGADGQSEVGGIGGEERSVGAADNEHLNKLRQVAVEDIAIATRPVGVAVLPDVTR
jgi:hypothetical protein